MAALHFSIYATPYAATKRSQSPWRRAGSVSWAVPFFSSLMALIAAFGDLQAAFALPALFTLKLFRLPTWQHRINWLLVGASAVLSIVAIYSSMYTMYESYTS